MLDHAPIGSFEIDGHVHRAAGGLRHGAGQHEAVADDPGPAGRRDPGLGGERIGHPLGGLEPPPIGPRVAGGVLDDWSHVTRGQAAVARGERSVAVVDQRARYERSVRRHTRSPLAKRRVVQRVGQADGLGVVGGVDGDELPDLAQPAEAPVERVEQGGRAGHLERGRRVVAGEHVERPVEDTLRRGRSRRDVELPSLAGQDHPVGLGVDPELGRVDVDRPGGRAVRAAPADRVEDRLGLGGHGATVAVGRRPDPPV